jgi:hypothetical protein
VGVYVRALWGLWTDTRRTALPTAQEEGRVPRVRRGTKEKAECWISNATFPAPGPGLMTNFVH